jgi:hypothetical protein
MKVLIACEFSGIVRDAFKERGHDALSCDLLSTEKPGKHYQGNILDILYSENWDLIISHIPCTYMCNSGVCHLYNKDGSYNIDRWIRLDESTNLFNKIWECDVNKICMENPIPHGYALERLPCKYTQIIHPYMFGHLEQKSTCLWLKNLPMLNETNNVKTEMMKLPDNIRQRLHYLPPGSNRQKERSRTFKNIAKAMADQ